MYKPNGKLRISGYYNNGIMDSLWEEKFITSEQVYQIKSFKNGMKHGVFQEFTINGDLFINGEYLNDRKNGDWAYYYMNSKMDMEGGFNEDQQHGYWKYYYPKGQLYYEGNFVNGQKDGDWKFYYNNGNIWRKGVFSHDQKNGLWTTLYENQEKSIKRRQERRRETKNKAKRGSGGVRKRKMSQHEAIRRLQERPRSLRDH